MTLRKTIVALALACAAGPVFAQETSTTIVEENDGTRTLIHEAVLDAPVARVWHSFTTADGWMDWGPSFAVVDLRPGGTIESSYSADAQVGDPDNIIHRILALVPERMIATRLEQIPPGGPVSEAVREATWSVYELEPVGNDRTRLRIMGLGYGEGEDFDRVISFFEAGNTYSLQVLQANIDADEDDTVTTEGGEN